MLPWLLGVARRALANQCHGAGRRAALLQRIGAQAAGWRSEPRERPFCTHPPVGALSSVRPAVTSGSAL